jgi:hypothetical protein
MAGRKKAGGSAPPEDPTANASPLEANANESNAGTEEPRKPAHTFSYPVARDTYVHASVWARIVKLSDGGEFVAHEVSVRKRHKDAAGEWQTAHSFRGSELYALVHALNQAAAWVLEARASANGCPF